MDNFSNNQCLLFIQNIQQITKCKYNIHMEFSGFHIPTYQTVDWNKEMVLIKENYTPMTFNTDSDAVPQNVATIQQMNTDYNKTGAQLQTNYKTLSTDVDKNKSSRKYLHDNNSKYHYSDIQDPNVILRPEESNDIKVAIQRDIQDMKLYQNSIYMVSMIAGATLLIATIILVKPSTK
jgi:hypothetical protein